MPDGIETVRILYLPDQHGDGNGKQWNTDHQAFDDGTLVEFEPLSHNQTGTAEGGIARGDGGSHHTQHGEDSTCHTQPVVTYQIHDSRCRGIETFRGLLDKGIARGWIAIEEPGCHRSPDQGYHTLGNHGTVENRTPHLLTLHATGHQRTLGGMETGDGTTGHRDKQSREDSILPRFWLGGGSHIVEVCPQLWQCGPVDEQPYHQGTSHKQQREGKQGIYFSDDLVDGQHRGNDVIAEDDDHPHDGLATDGMQNLRRRIYKHRSHHDEQQHGKYQHDTLRGLA